MPDSIQLLFLKNVSINLVNELNQIAIKM